MSAAGLYKHPIKIQKYNVVQNKYGEQEIKPSSVIDTRAWIRNLSNNREAINNETFYNDTKQVMVHIYLNINEFDHVIIKDKDYRIVSMVRDEDRQNITLNIELVNK